MSTTNQEATPTNRRLLRVMIILGVFIVFIAVRVIFPDSPTIFAGTQPSNLGVSQDKLALCPLTPNCVSSQSQDTEHYIDPIVYQGSPKTAIASLQEIINQQEQTKIITVNDQYLYAQFSSRWLGFVDDVEFYLNDNKKVIEVRSASRLGESDFGVNRQRIETIRQQFNSI
ncbi:protein of unknown function DUF1499 [Rippkaea orientalis PCC 8801]|uniref:DUF1499 domain-containing protein n=1 Tax=Rippkaea orientalis (strain PCC 8801 / RF-1) TaxID=41431 RepID=B7K465_RIPO1|nr:DUF1499 domain-containing protein [Rippkaea orientalis]ACK67771.1 protein of unknown function DUF1499 [Rippkaea orientalis PCC 8801]